MSGLDETLISVVIPVYASEQYIDQCIDSVVTQSHRNIEIICVNDGSPDRSGKICDRAADLDRRIRVVHQPNSGLVSARKAGVSIARGKYLSFVDGDDWVSPEFLENMYELIVSNSADLVIGGHVRDFRGKQEMVSPLISAGVYDKTEIRKSILPSAIFNGHFFQHGVSTYVWNKLFKRQEATQLIGKIPPSIVIGEDAALTYPYLHTTSRIVVTHNGEYFYRQRPRSILKSVQDTETEFASLSILFQHLTTSFGHSELDPNLQQQLRMYFISLVLIRSGGVIASQDSNSWFTPFSGLKAHQRIVVYSSGSFGQHLISALTKLGYFEIVAWIDDDVEESQREGLPVTSMDSVINIDFDLIMIASIDSIYSEKIASQLQQRGIENTRISRVLPDFEKLEEVLMQVGFDLDSYKYSPKTFNFEECL